MNLALPFYNKKSTDWLAVIIDDECYDDYYYYAISSAFHNADIHIFKWGWHRSCLTQEKLYLC